MIGKDYEETNQLLAGLRNGAWLDAQTFEPLRYSVPGILPEGMVLMVGPPKVGKSWLLLDVALAVSQGGYALGTIRVEQRPVLYLALEDGDRRMQDRCRTLQPGQPIPAGLNYMTAIEPGQVLATVAAWLELQDTNTAPLIICDTLGKVMPPAMPQETTYQRDYRVGGKFKALADAHPGCCLVVNHHVRKAGSDDFVDSVSGTNGLAGAADTIVVVSRARHETAGILKVTGRDVNEDEYAVGFTSAQWTLDGPDLEAAAKNAATIRATSGVGDTMARVIDIVAKAGTPVGPKYIAKAIDCSPDKASTYLGRAVDAGRLERVGRGQYTPVGSVGSVGNDSETNSPNTTNTPTGRLIRFPNSEHPNEPEDQPACLICKRTRNVTLNEAGYCYACSHLEGADS